MRSAAWWRLPPVGLGTLAVSLDTALNIAFPAMTGHFGLALPEIQWVVTSYMLVFGSLMLGVGRLGDIFGHAPVFRAGLAVSAAALLLCGLAPSYPWLLAGRVLQGVGAALVIGCGPALATGLFPEAQRGRVLGLYALAFAAGGVLGPSLGGLLLAQFGWPAVFWFRVPVALLALVLLRHLPAPPRGAMREPFDLAGAALLALATASLLLALAQARHLGQGDWGQRGWAALPLAGLFLAALAGFLHRSRTVPRPVIELRHFRRPGFARLNAANALANLAGFAVLLFMPYLLAGHTGLPVAAAGLVLAAAPGGTMLAAAPAGWLLGRMPAWSMTRLGVALTGLGLGLVALWRPGLPVWLLAPCLLLVGAGQGLTQVGYTEIVTATLPRRDRGVAGSLAMMTRTLGIVAAAALLSLWFEIWQAAAVASGATPAVGFLRGFAAVFALAAGLCGAVLLLLAPPGAEGPRQPATEGSTRGPRE